MSFLKQKNCSLIIFASIFYIVLINNLNAQNLIINSQNNQLMPIGAYYYPEHWPREDWGRDIKRMAELGFSFTHMAEFAWANLEPEEGKFDFEWLDWCVAEAAKNGLKVILCTPSPCPPVWLTTKYPEILNVNESGQRSAYSGVRLEANQSNPVYRKYIERIVSKMANHYGNNPAVLGWQIDNEPHLGTIYDYSEFAEADFKNWLQKRYNNISALNSSWGNAFWSSSYNSFAQIRIPNVKESASNPHAMIDFNRYTADGLAESIRFQAKLLRKLVSPKQWITTNYAYYKFLPPVDLFRNKGDLDFASHTMYLLSTFLNYPEGALNFRLGSGMELSFSNEMAKSIEGYTGIMELQPGQINWGTYNAQPLPGAVRMWIWHCFGLDDQFTCTYRFRQPLFGGEQTHKGIMETDGVTVARGGKEYVQAIAEIKNLQKYYQPNPVTPKTVSSRKTAFLWKQDNLWEMQASPHTKSWDTWQHYYTYYGNLKTMGAPVQFIQETDEFNPEKIPFMVAPAYSMVDKKIIAKWAKYVEEGGHLILSCRTGQKDRNGHFHETLLQQPIWELIGAKIEDNDQLPSTEKATVKADGKYYNWNVWGELIKPNEGTETLAVYSDQFYAGTSAVVTRKIGKGTITYIGVWTTNGELEKQILRKVYQQTGANILDLPAYVFVEWRDGFYVGVNYTSNPVKLPVSEKVEMLIGNREIQPGEVGVWKEN